MKENKTEENVRQKKEKESLYPFCEEVATATDFKAAVYCDIQRHLPGGD